MTYLFKKSKSNYYFRVIIHRQLKVYFHRTEIKKSLETKDYNLALLKAKILYDKYCKVLQAIKMDVLSDEQIQELVNKFILDTFGKSKTDNKTTTQHNFESTHFTNILQGVIDEKPNDCDYLSPITKSLLSIIGIEFNPSEQSHQLFQQTLLKGHKKMFKDVLTKAKNVSKENNNESTQPKTYLDAYEEYKIYYNDQQTSKMTKEDTFRVLDRLMIIVGKNTSIINTKLTDLIKIKQKIESLPNLNFKEYNKLSFEEILKLDNIPIEHKITDSRAKDYIKHIKKFFSFCYQNQIISFDPSVNLTVAVSSDKKERFTDEEMNQLFKVFDLQEPILRLFLYTYAYTGMRREELYNSSIEAENGVLYFDIRDGKNDFAKRKIPLNSRLIELGLTNDILTNCQTKYSVERIGRLFNEKIKHQVTTSKTKTLHCFRHTIATKLQANGVSDSFIQNILGHSAKDTLNKVYARNKTNLTALRGIVDLIKFE